MTELEKIGAAEPPRPAELTAPLARRFVPAWGFVVYGALYMFLAFLVGGAALVATALALGSRDGRPGPVWFQIAICAAGLAGFTISWWPFSWWVKRRRGEAHRLFRDGELVAATVVSGHHLMLNGAMFTRATVRFTDRAGTHEAIVSIAGHPPEIAAGATLPLLTEPSCS